MAAFSVKSMPFSTSFFKPPLLANAVASSEGNPLEPIISGSLSLGGVGALTAALAYGGTCLALRYYQTKLIFRPLPHLLFSPADVGLPYEDVWIPVHNSEGKPAGKIHGWWLPNPSCDRVMLFCHGNYGNISFNLERIRFHYKLGFSVLAIDYRGYGQSPAAQPSAQLAMPSLRQNEPQNWPQNWPQSQIGEFPTEQSTYEDADAAWQFLTDTRQIPPEKITVCGHSLGGAIAIHLATCHPEVGRLIVKSSFTRMQDVIEARKIYRFFPVEYLLTQLFDSISKVQQLQMPVLYVHGQQDTDVPAYMSEHLYEASPQPKQLWLAPTAGHNDISQLMGETYGNLIHGFCTERSHYHFAI